MNIITRICSLLLIVTALLVFQVSALSPLTISSSDIGKTAVISGLPEGTDVQIVLNNGVPVPMKVDSDGSVKYLVLLEGTLEAHASLKGNVIDNFSLTLHSTIIPTPTPSGGGGSTSSGAGSSGEGTYPTFTTTPIKGSPTSTLTTPIVTTVEPTVTIPQPTETTIKQTTAIPVATQKSPGLGIVVTIGIFGTIYILRKMK